MTDSPKSFWDRIEREPKIPGTRPGESPKVRYVSFAPGDAPADEFDRVLGRIEPLIPQRGGVCLDNCIITLPDGTMFYALAYHADVEGWQRQIEGGARELGLNFAWIDGDNFAVSDGRSVPLAACKVKFCSLSGRGSQGSEHG